MFYLVVKNCSGIDFILQFFCLMTPSQYGAVLSTNTMEFQWNLSLLVKYLPLREAT